MGSLGQHVHDSHAVCLLRFLSQNIWWISEARKHADSPDELLNCSGGWQGAGENWSLVDYFLTVCWHGVRITSLQLVVHQQHSVSSWSAPTNGISCFLWLTGNRKLRLVPFWKVQIVSTPNAWSGRTIRTKAPGSLFQLLQYSKPTTCKTSDNNLKRCLSKSSFIFQSNSLLPFFFLSSELITDNQIEIGQLKAELKDKVMYTLLRKHRHQTKKSNLRSLADIGKTVSSASRLFSNQENGNTVASLVQSLFFKMKCRKKTKFVVFFVTSS